MIYSFGYFLLVTSPLFFFSSFDETSSIGLQLKNLALRTKFKVNMKKSMQKTTAAAVDTMGEQKNTGQYSSSMVWGANPMIPSMKIPLPPTLPPPPAILPPPPAYWGNNTNTNPMFKGTLPPPPPPPVSAAAAATSPKQHSNKAQSRWKKILRQNFFSMPNEIHIEIKKIEMMEMVPTTLKKTEQTKTKVLLFCTSEYEAIDIDEISMIQGDTIILIKHEDENWSNGKNQRTGEIGLFPREYVERLIPKV